MSLALASSLHKRNMSAPSLFVQNSGASVSREQLQRIAMQNNANNSRRADSSQSLPRSVHDDRTVESGDIVTINVSGRRYQTYISTLQRFPNSLLGDPTKRKHFFKKDTKEYFFDRNRKAFSGVLHYFQSNGNEIACPHGVSEKIFAQELLYFELYEQKHSTDSETSSDEFSPTKENFSAKVWALFEKPKSSKPAKVLAVFSICIILLSITVFCLETIPTLNPDKPEGSHMRPIWYTLNVFCNVWFTVEFIIRFLSSPKKLDFIKSAVNLIDLLSILPFYLSEVIGNTGEHSLSVLRVIRVIRVIRIFKLTRHSRGLHILANTIKASFEELLMLVLFLAIAVILFASAVYFAETHSEGGNEKFESIPHSFWWAVITMTTVGYGDLTPKTLIGQLVGALCAISGVLVIALPVPVIVSNFEHYYKVEQSRQAREEELTRKEQEEETFADMRKSIQMMTHTSIILAGGIRKNTNDQNNNSDGGVGGGGGGNKQRHPDQQHECDNNKKQPTNKLFKRKSFKERLQDKLSFTFQRQYTDVEHCTNENACSHSEPTLEHLELNNGGAPINLPDIRVNSLPLSRPSSAAGILQRTHRVADDSSTDTLDSEERVWFIDKNDKSKESKI